MNKIRTGIFGGSFNPIHIGHLALANYLCEYDGLDELWFVVTPQNPLKTHNNMLSDAKRLQMVEEAINNYPKFRASDIELTLPKPSYTIGTLEQLRLLHPDREFVLVIGSDNWICFDRWKDSERIIREYRILIYPRQGYIVDALSLPPTACVAPAPLIEISSTFIRKAISEGKKPEFFLHPTTYRIISEEGLYK